MVEILGVPFSTMTFEETTAKLKQALHGETPHHIITAAPEVIMMAQTNDTIMRMLREADIVTPDGIGAVWASQFYGTKIQERVTGAELSSALIEHCAAHGLRVFLLGATPQSNALALEKLRGQHPGLVIDGHDGYFKTEQEPEVVAQIKAFAPYLLLVGLGQPRQEVFIFTHKQELRVPVSIGIGGVIDIFAGTVKRAPKFWRDLHLEWFYRLMSQPSRWRRQLVLPQFVLTVLRDKKRVR